MRSRRKFVPDLKAKVALEALASKYTLAELAAKFYITWKPHLHFTAGVLSILLLSSCTHGTEPTATVVITNVNVVDVSNGVVLEGRAITIKGDRIQSILATSEASPAEKVIDGGGRYVIPGLWDMHVHLGIWDWETAFPQFLKAGVLGIREMGWEIDEPVELRDRVASGKVLGPRMVVAGPTLDGPTDDWPLRVTLKEIGDVTPTLRMLEDAGVDFVKVHQKLPPPVYFEIAKQAQDRGFSFVGHVPGEITALDALNAGQASIEHLIMPWCEFNKDGVCESDEVNETIAGFLRNEAWAVPTMTVYLANYHMFVEPRQREMGKDFASSEVKEHWDYQARVNEEFLPPADEREAMFRDVYRSSRQMLKYLADSGVDMMTGTDAGYLHVYPGESLHDELTVWVEAGISPLQALQAATIQPARFLHLDADLGTVERGKIADFVLLEGNPLEDIRNVRHVAGVMIGGEYYTPSDIEEAFRQ